MEKTVKRNIFFSAALFLLAVLFAAFFFLFPSKAKTVDASADASPTSGSLYWERGAAINNRSTNHMIKFTLHIDPVEHGGMDSILIIDTGASLNANKNAQVGESVDNGSMKNMSVELLYRDYNDDGTLGELKNKGKLDNIAKYGNNGRDSSAYFEYSCLELDHAEITIEICFNVDDIYQDITMVAGIYSGRYYETLKDQAVSDTRNLHYIWEKAYANEDPAFLKNTYMMEYMDFEKTVNANEFLISPAVSMSSYGMYVQIHIPEKWRDLLYNPVEELVALHGSYSAYQYTNYCLVVTTSPKATDYDNQEISDSRSVGRSSDWFKGNALGEEYMYHSPTALQTNFQNYGCGIVSLGLSEGEYYYASIVKVVSKPEWVLNEEESKWYDKVYEIKYFDEYEILAITDAQEYFDYSEIAAKMLGSDLSLTMAERQWLLRWTGIRGETTIPIKVTYKKMQENAQNYGEIISVTEDVGYVFAEEAFAGAIVESELKRKYGIDGVHEYDIVFNGAYYQDGYRYNTDGRIVLQAKDFKYTFYEGESAKSSYGVLEVVYEDFQYKDSNFRITNNDWNNHLTMNWYTTNVSVDSQKGETTLTYKYDDIEEQLYNSCMWLFDITAEKINYSPVEGVSVTAGESEVQVTYKNYAVNNLLYLQLTAVAEIMEDYEINVTYKYNKYNYENFALKIEEKTSAPFTMLYSEWQGWLNFTNFMKKYGATIDSALECEYLEGEYYVPTSIKKNVLTGYDKPTAEIIVEYKTNPTFKITDNISEYARYKSLTLQSGMEYKGEFFVDSENIPEGYRISSMSSNSSLLEITSNEDFKKTSVVYKGNYIDNIIVPISIEYTDLWNLKIGYMKQIIGTPFAEFVTEEKQIKVLDYDDVYALSQEDLLKILSMQTFDITGSVTVAEHSVKFDNVSTYTVDLKYSHASLKQINYEGEMTELKVPLTSYADWCNSFGKDWSILMLNTEKKQYFKYSSDVARDRLYGLFSVAIFDEQVSDLSYYFKHTTGDGSMTIFTENQVHGSKAYAFFDNLRTKGIISSILGHVGMAFCELVNDDNKIQYMNYFYLDGTNPNGAFISNGGADNAQDTDDAIVNKGEDIVDDVKDTVNNVVDDVKDTVNNVVSGVQDAVNKNKVWLSIVLSVLIGVAVFGAAFWMLRKFGVIKALKGKRAGSKKGGSSKKKTTKKKAPKNATKGKK